LAAQWDEQIKWKDMSTHETGCYANILLRIDKSLIEFLLQQDEDDKKRDSKTGANTF
jgi:hypothetical protein